MEKDAVFLRYQEAKTERQRFVNVWRDVGKYVNVIDDVTSNFKDVKVGVQNKDIYINDPTGQIAMNNSADYMLGILWGSGKNVFEINPSDELLRITGDEGVTREYFKYITSVAERQINHPDAGFLPSAISFLQEQVSYGTSGTGTFPNPEYNKDKGLNALLFDMYSVNNCCIDEGKNGRINIIFRVRNWRVSRVVQEFSMIDGVIDNKLYSKLPDEVKKSWEKQDYGKKFKLVNAIMPNGDYLTSAEGKNGTRFKGVWWIEGEEKIFFEEYYKELPVSMCRLIKTAGEVYGLSPAILCLSSLRLLNFAMGQAAESVEKLNRPARGIFSGALPMGSEIDDSAGGVTVFNGKVADGSPMFNVSSVGDISALVQLLIPKLENDITNIFKIDKLLDFNNATQMTATESLHRFGIRIKSIGTMIQQLVNEWLHPMLVRVISLLDYMDLLGVDPAAEDAKKLIDLGLNKMVIPESIKLLKSKGLPWYEIKFKNEIEKFMNADLYENLSKFLNIFGSMAQMKPELMEAIKPYELISLLSEITSMSNENILYSETQFKKKIEALAQQQAQAMQVQQDNIQSQTMANVAGAEKNAREIQQQSR